MSSVGIDQLASLPGAGSRLEEEGLCCVLPLRAPVFSRLEEEGLCCLLPLRAPAFRLSSIFDEIQSLLIFNQEGNNLLFSLLFSLPAL